MSHDVDVIVIGAGMAGVTTAWALRQVGIRTIVLEARPRIGGRICTSRTWKNLPCDLGAGWVSHPSINPLIPMAARNKIDLTPSDPSNVALFEASGRSLPRYETDALFALYATAYAEVKYEAQRRRDRGRPDVALSKVLPSVLDDMDLDLATRRGVEFFFNLSVTEAYAADAKDLSLYNWDDDYTEVFLKLWVVPDGYIRFVEMLKKGLDIRREHVVSEITWKKDGVTVATRHHGKFHAEHAVITVPHGVLARGCITFNPPLPGWKQAAIDRLHTGLSDKFWFHFPRKFWKSNRDTLGRIDPTGKGEWSSWFNFHKVTGEPVLLCFNRTSHAAKLEKMSDDAVVAEAMGVLRAEFGRRIPEPIAMQRSKWGTEEFSQGTLAHVPPGASAEDHRTLARPVGRLRFAGDATCVEFNTQVIGAFLSGIREAERLVCEYISK